MKQSHPAPLGLTVSVLAGCGSPQLQSEPSSSRPAADDGRCVERDGLPDPRCTPGAIRSGVSLVTICASGYSRSVRPPESFTEPLKLRQMRAYDLPGSPRDYEEDHLVALSIGGAPRDPATCGSSPAQARTTPSRRISLRPGPHGWPAPGAYPWGACSARWQATGSRFTARPAASACCATTRPAAKASPLSDRPSDADPGTTSEPGFAP